MKKVLITGGNGYIASSIFASLSEIYEISTVSRKDFDLIDYYSLSQWIENKYFDVVIHTATEGGNRLKQEDGNTLYRNLLMYDNLLDHKSHYKKFITFGSGAEFTNPKSPYGLSKRIIADSIKQNDNFYNLRIWGVFDENEEDRRFIKSNIRRYINKEPMIVSSNKKMDFIFMDDLIHIIKSYIENDNQDREIDCTYSEKFSLLDIANKINNLSDYNIDITVSDKVEQDYIGRPCKIDGLKSLDYGIKKVYQKLLGFTNENPKRRY